MPDFLLLRHAPTSWNADGRIQGRADVLLSPEGRAAARAWRLPPFAASWPCVSSPLARAAETARAMGLRPVADAAFAEMDWGQCEGETLAALRLENGGVFAREERKGLDFRPPDGETPREVGRRALAGLRRLEGDAVIVTHKGVLRALLAAALGWTMQTKPPVRLEAAAAHFFRIAPGEPLRLVHANIALATVETVEGVRP